ncbi:hypothetical protein CK203_104539 [Vitis vinifera]|uniref:Uncharacterized protein n=1 Tax=Vitis vinifera TaxID=29760 RepID=A0A438FGL1_VITVI|nr:hypothetical protein CK203_104539 [Vitis vinifera]
MKERSVLSALIEVLDGGWVFTISVAVVGVEEVRQGREMGESTQEDFVPHSWNVVEDELREIDQRLMEVLLLGSWQNEERRESQKAETIPMGHMAREDWKW